MLPSDGWVTLATLHLVHLNCASAEMNNSAVPRMTMRPRGTCCKCNENRQEGLVSAGQAHANATSAAPGKILLTPPSQKAQFSIFLLF